MSAGLFLILYPLINSRFIRKHWHIISFMMVVLALPLSQLFVYIISFTKYKYYFESYLTGGGIIKYELILNFILYIIYVIILKDYKENKYSFAFLVSEFVTLFIAYLSVYINVSEMISRLTYIFSYGQMLSIPYVLSKIKLKRYKIGYLYIIYSAFLFNFFYNFVYKNYHEVMHYLTYWSK